MPTVQMPDEELAELGRRYKKYQEKAAKYEAKKKKVGAKIIAEMKRRRTHQLTTNGVKVTHTIQRRVVHDFFKYQEKLTPKQLRRIQTKTVDPSAVLAMVAAGDISGGVLAECSSEVVHAEYPSISFVEEGPDE